MSDVELDCLDYIDPQIAWAIKKSQKNGFVPYKAYMLEWHPERVKDEFQIVEVDVIGTVNGHPDDFKIVRLYNQHTKVPSYGLPANSLYDSPAKALLAQKHYLLSAASRIDSLFLEQLCK